MVGGTPKPFACTNEGCTMTFTNEDHLNVHQKKHEMVLNLGCKQNFIVADQTPTPTRFLRNCEEVGLFQDLQNVNPFEETFRRAVELVKTGSLPEPDLPEDDTLHTPHVFPHLPEENVNIYTSTLKSEKLSLNNVDLVTQNDSQTIHTSHTTIISEKSSNSAIDKDQTILISDKTFTLSTTVTSPDHIYALDSETCIALKDSNKKVNQFKHRKHYKEITSTVKATHTPTKLKLKQALDQKKQRLAEKHDNTITQSFLLNPVSIQNYKITPHDKITFVNNVTPVYQSAISTTSDLPAILPKLETVHLPLNQNIAYYPLVTDNHVNGENGSNKVKARSRSDDSCVDSKRQGMLERNRAAAIRCRERKKQWIGTLEQKLHGVCKDNAELQKEVSDLRNEVLHLKTLLLAHKECPVTKAMNMGHNIVIGPPQIVTIPVTLSNGVSTNQESENNNGDVTNINKANGDSRIFNISKTKTSVIVLNNSFHDMNH